MGPGQPREGEDLGWEALAALDEVTEVDEVTEATA
jgi:hypothetical protein